MSSAPKAIIFTALSALPAMALAGPLSVPPDSFINQHVATVPQLGRQVTLDPTVRRRLARHFHLSGPALVHYIQNDLVLTRLRTARRFPVSCISRSGREYTIIARLPTGTPVFALRGTGQPILKLACGNPLVSSLPSVKVSPSLEALGSPKTAALPSRRVASVKPALAPTTPVDFVLASTGQQIIAPLTPPVVKVAAFPITQLAHASRGVSPFGLLAGLPILYGIFHKGGGGNNSFATTAPPSAAPPVITPNPTPTPNPGPGTTGGNTGPISAAPEPSPYVLLGFFVFGAAGLALRSRKGQRA